MSLGRRRIGNKKILMSEFTTFLKELSLFNKENRHAFWWAELLYLGVFSEQPTDKLKEEFQKLGVLNILAKPHKQSIEDLIGRYKSITTRGFWEYGRKGKIWARGFDTQLCCSIKELNARLNYVQRHND